MALDRLKHHSWAEGCFKKFMGYRAKCLICSKTYGSTARASLKRLR